jgi:hypothetical protein
MTQSDHIEGLTGCSGLDLANTLLTAGLDSSGQPRKIV